MEESYDVVGVGRAVYDLAVVISQHPQADEKTESLDRYEGGGSPVPTALCQLARWKWRTLLNAVIGMDYFGDLFLKSTQSFGVHTEAVIRRADEATPRAFIWVEQKSGKRTVVLDRTITPLAPAELPHQQLKFCRALLIDGWEAEAAIAAAKIVHASGGKVMLDAGNVRPRMEEQLALADWIIVPMAFVRAYYGEMNVFEVVKHLRRKGAELAIVANGAGGCVASWETETAWFQASPAKVVDTTGAGDVYHAAIFHGLFKKWSVPETIRWASAAAALATTALGGRGKLPTENEVQDFLNL